jgi:hypothetical protein
MDSLTLRLYPRKTPQILTQLVHSRCHASQLRLSITHVPVKPLIQRTHIPHNLPLLVDRCLLRKTVILEEVEVKNSGETCNDLP